MIAEKLNILKVGKESGIKKRVDIAKELGTAQSTLNSIVPKATEIKESVQTSGASSNKRTRVPAVSYTHLDVYKRQVQHAITYADNQICYS